jgi:hypothetical protein
MKKERKKMQQQLNALTRPQLIALVVQKEVIAYSDAVQMGKTTLIDKILAECDGEVLRPVQA